MYFTTRCNSEDSNTSIGYYSCLPTVIRDSKIKLVTTKNSTRDFYDGRCHPSEAYIINEEEKPSDIVP